MVTVNNERYHVVCPKCNKLIYAESAVTCRFDKHMWSRCYNAIAM